MAEVNVHFCLVYTLVVCFCIEASYGSRCRGKAPCVSLRDCAPFISLVEGMEKPLKPSVVVFLRSQQCGFSDGYPKVCCSVIPKKLKIFGKTKPVNPTKVVSLTAQVKHYKPVQLFDITVSTAPPSATAVPYIKLLQERERNLNHLMEYDLFRRRRSNSPVDIEIR